MTDAQIKHLVDRFLAWRLPADFQPDGGVSFTPIQNFLEAAYEPKGTNLLTATQADTMVRHMLIGMPETAWVIEAPGPNYLEARKLGSQYEFHWTKDSTNALRFFTSRQADMTLMAVREASPKLFAFSALLGDAKAAEHGWVNLKIQVPAEGST